MLLRYEHIIVQYTYLWNTASVSKNCKDTVRLIACGNSTRIISLGDPYEGSEPEVSPPMKKKSNPVNDAVMTL